MKTVLAVLLLALAGNSLAADSAGSPAEKDGTSSGPAYAEKLRSDAQAVLQGPDFHRMSRSTLPVPRPWLEKWLRPAPKKTQDSPAQLPDFPRLAQLLKILVIVAAALLLGWLLWRGWQWLTPPARQPALPARGRLREAQTLRLPDEAALPASISASAALAWQAGQQVQALSLLYRGAVAALASQHQLSLPDGATEDDYLRLLRRSGKGELASGFTLIAQAWMSLAYAQRSPADFQALLQAYRQHFEMTGGRS